MPKCKKGYNCGLACISVTYMCRREFPEGISVSIDGMRTVIKNMLEESMTMETEPLTSSMDFTPQTLMDEDGNFHSIDPNFNFYNLKQGEVLGAGVFGRAVLTDEDPPRVVKSGMIGENEVEALQLASRLGIGPKVYAAQYDLSTKDNADIFNLKAAMGRVLMDRVDGDVVARGPIPVPEETLNKIIEARAKLHKSGFAHNDMHGGNVILDKQGNVKLIDLGLSSKSPVSSLLEAIGDDSAFDRILEHEGGSVISQRLHTAKQKVTRQMLDDGMPRELVLSWRTSKSRAYKDFIKKADELGWNMNPTDINRYINMFYAEVDSQQKSD
ncbi:MAG: hypothetical protein R3321_01405 [Nitrososphaeraceae archaeon]|nr:hypothetical protein [Nitrososphaeraceae archaeon]